MKVRGKKPKANMTGGKVLLFVFHAVRNPIRELIVSSQDVMETESVSGFTRLLDEFMEKFQITEEMTLGDD